MFIKKILPPLACDFLGLFIPGKLGQIFFEDLDTICEPYIVSYIKCGSKPKNGVPSLKIDES